MTLSVSLTLVRPNRRIEVDFQVDPGESVAVLGPNGAGKSTVLAGISGLLRPAAGRVRLFGDVLFDAASGVDLPVGRRALGVLLQRPSLFPHLDVRHNVAFGLHEAIWRAPRVALDRAQAALDAHGLGSLATRAPSTLSGGEAQKVALLRMLVRAPRAWLFDEPLTGLDLVARRELLALLRAMPSRPRDESVAAPRLYVVHDPRDALALASRWIVLDEGRVVALGSPLALEEVAPSAFASALREEVRELVGQGASSPRDPELTRRVVREEGAAP